MGFLDGQLLEAEELNEKWAEMAPEYMVDAVREVNSYPAVVFSWATYLGMGMASVWDGAWEQYSTKDDLYKSFREPRGFDAMDEYIIEEFLGLGLDSQDNKSLEELLRTCSHSVMSVIRNEKIEPQTTDAFYILSSTCKVLFRLGVAIELKQLGYKYEKVKVEMPDHKIS